ncbi:MAG: glycosyltransferase [Candidatus Obscuribacterales bacterium]|nr:glycosyltransferase [Candidatus Obscuribacterales bacterium]
MSEKPLISVCLPVYNGAKYLDAAVRSVLKQTHGEFELLISDDQSVDDSAEICRGYAEQDSRVRFWINDRRLGLFGNYNHTIQSARGTFIKTFAQDDLLEPRSLEVLSAVLLENPEVSLVSSARQVIDANGACTYVRRPFPHSMQVPSREVITFNLINLNNWIGEPSTVMFRQRDAGFGFDSAFYHYGDIEYWFRLLERGNYYFVDEVLCSFRRHPESQTDKNHKELLFALDILRLSLSYRRYLADIEPEELFRRRISETVALHLGHIGDRLSQDPVTNYETDFLKHTDGSGDAAARTGFRVLAAYALTSVTELLSELDHEKRCRIDENERFATEVEKMRNSLYWKLTGPLRAVRDSLKE